MLLGFNLRHEIDPPFHSVPSHEINSALTTHAQFDDMCDTGVSDLYLFSAISQFDRASVADIIPINVQ